MARIISNTRVFWPPLLVLSLLSACGGNDPIGEVFFIEPLEAAQVTSPVTVEMGSTDLILEPAQEDSDYEEGYGHHHIIIDSELPLLNQPIPKGVRHLHFGDAQSEVQIELEPGEHTLQLLFAKGDHVSWEPVIADTITITVVG